MANNKTNRVKIKSMTLIVLELIRKGWTVEVAAKAAEDFYSRIMDEKSSDKASGTEKAEAANGQCAKVWRRMRESGAEPLSFDENGNPVRGEASISEPTETENLISRLRSWIKKLEGDKVELKDELDRGDNNYGKLLLEKQALETDLKGANRSYHELSAIRSDLMKEAEAKNKEIEVLKQHNESLVKGNYGLMQQLYDKDAELTKIHESLKEIEARNKRQAATIENLMSNLKPGLKADEALKEISRLKAQLAEAESKRSLCEDALLLANKDCTAFAKRFEEDEKTIKKLEDALQFTTNKYEKVCDARRELLKENMSLVAKLTALEMRMNGPVAPTIDRYENTITREAAEAKKYPKARKRARKEDLNDPVDNGELASPTPVDGDPEQVPVYPKDGNSSSDARDGGSLDSGDPFDDASLGDPDVYRKD